MTTGHSYDDSRRHVDHWIEPYTTSSHTLLKADFLIDSSKLKERAWIPQQLAEPIKHLHLKLSQQISGRVPAGDKFENKPILSILPTRLEYLKRLIRGVRVTDRSLTVMRGAIGIPIYGDHEYYSDYYNDIQWDITSLFENCKRQKSPNAAHFEGIELQKTTGSMSSPIDMVIKVYKSKIHRQPSLEDVITFI